MHLNANDSSSFGNKFFFLPFITYFLLLYGNKKKKRKGKSISHFSVKSTTTRNLIKKSILLTHLIAKTAYDIWFHLDFFFHITSPFSFGLSFLLIFVEHFYLNFFIILFFWNFFLLLKWPTGMFVTKLLNRNIFKECLYNQVRLLNSIRKKNKKEIIEKRNFF